MSSPRSVSRRGRIEHAQTREEISLLFAMNVQNSFQF